MGSVALNGAGGARPAWRKSHPGYARAWRISAAGGAAEKAVFRPSDHSAAGSAVGRPFRSSAARISGVALNRPTMAYYGVRSGPESLPDMCDTAQCHDT